MKSILVNYSDLAGGAAIAAYRIHKSLRSLEVDSSMWVNKKLSDDFSVYADDSLAHRLTSQLKASGTRSLAKSLFKEASATYRSYNVLPSGLGKRLDASDAQLVHLVWVNGECLSINQIGRLKKPVVMTLQDMWAFCGAEHYAQNQRYQTGYDSQSRPSELSGVDVDRWIWRRKAKAWSQPFPLVAISDWLATCVRSSSLFSDWPVSVIPNPVDTDLWKPLDKSVARSAYNLPLDKKIIVFGALGGTSNPRKGYAYLDKALAKLAAEHSDIHLVIYGQSAPEKPLPTHFPTTYVGRLADPVALCVLNNAADVFVNPAIQEAFGQTASEAHACGVPVVAFENTGIADIIEHKASGYLATLRDADDLATGLSWVLERVGNAEQANALSAKARSRAETFFFLQSSRRTIP